MHRSLSRFIFAIVLAFAILPSATAFAAPIPWRGVDVTLHAEQSGGVMLVSGEMTETVPLPAEAEFSVPAGSSIQWIGEILGGDPSADPELTYIKTTVDGADIYRFTLTKSRNAQIEVLTSGFLFDGSLYNASLAWTPAQDVPEVRLIVRVPQGAQVATSSPGGSLQPGDSGYSYFAKTFPNAKAGDQLDLTVGYTLPAAGSEPAATGASDAGTIGLVVLIALVAAAAIALVLVLGRSKGAGSGGIPSSEEPEEETPAPLAASDVSPTDAAADTDEVPSFETSRPSAAKRNLLTVSVIGVFIVAAVLIGAQTTKPKSSGDTISKTYSAGEPCETAVIPLAVPDSTDAQTAADALFAALGPVGGLNTATYNLKTSSLSVGYCESKTTEPAIRDALAPTGLIAP